MEYSRIAVNTSKEVFTLHGVDASGQVVVRRDLTRARFEAFFAKLAPCQVVLGACAGSHHWGRRLGALGHRVRLIAPQYVKPDVKRGKNDRLDAGAICAAAGRPGMRFVAVKSAERQGAIMVLRARQLLVVGATAVIRFAKPGSKSASPWLLGLLERKPRKLTAVALANKMARIVWAMSRQRRAGAMMTRGEAYRRGPVAQPVAG